MTETFTFTKSTACHHREHNRCHAGWPLASAPCQCHCHVQHLCPDCGVEVAAARRCPPCAQRYKMTYAMECQQKRIETVLDEPLLTEAREAHRRIMELIG